MAQLGMDPAQDREFWHGVLSGLRWALFVVVGLIALLAASEAEDPIDYACGLGVFAAMVALIFWETKRHFDGAPPPTIHDLVIEDMGALMLGLPLLLLLGLAGLFLASDSRGPGGYYGGLGLAVGAVLMAFLSLKASYDSEEAGGAHGSAVPPSQT
jgi:hypothetical protein